MLSHQSGHYGSARAPQLHGAHEAAIVRPSQARPPAQTPARRDACRHGRLLPRPANPAHGPSHRSSAIPGPSSAGAPAAARRIWAPAAFLLALLALALLAGSGCRRPSTPIVPGQPDAVLPISITPRVSWSPDGKRLAAMIYQVGLLVIDRSSGTVRTICQRSPGRVQIEGFTWREGPDDLVYSTISTYLKGPHILHAVDAAGHPEASIALPPSKVIVGMAWAPASHTLAVALQGADINKGTLWLLGQDLKVRKRLKLPLAMYYLRWRLGRPGHLVFLVRRLAGDLPGVRLCDVDTPNGATTDIARGLQALREGWFLSSRGMVYTLSGGGAPYGFLARYDPKTGATKALVRPHKLREVMVQEGRFSANGKRAALVSRGRIYVADVQTGRLRQVTSGWHSRWFITPLIARYEGKLRWEMAARGDSDPALSPDGSRLAYFHAGYQLWTKNLVTGRARLVYPPASSAADAKGPRRRRSKG